MPSKLLPTKKAFFRKVTKGFLEGEAGKPAREALPYSKMTTEDLANIDVVTTLKSVAELERLAFVPPDQFALPSLDGVPSAALGALFPDFAAAQEGAALLTYSAIVTRSGYTSLGKTP